MHQGGLVILFTVLFSGCVCQSENTFAEETPIDVNKSAANQDLLNKNSRRHVFSTTNSKLSDLTNVTATSTNSEISGTREGKCTLVSVKIINQCNILIFKIQ